MNTTQMLSAERIAEIKAFKNMDFSDCPIQSAEELAQFKPKYPENFENKTQVHLEGTVDTRRRATSPYATSTGVRPVASGR